ncbi:hypothetical protein ACO0SA_004774 [Hanseniaspora valbyensis]
MAKITFTDELLNQPLPEPIYKKDTLSNKKIEEEEDDYEAPPTASSFKQSEQDFESVQREQESFNKKQQKLAKKNKNLQQLRNKKQKEQSKQQEKEENIEDNVKEKISIDKLKAFEQQLINMQQKTERNRKLGKNGEEEEEEELEELDMDFLESISENTKSQSISSIKPKKTVFQDKDVQQNILKQAKYDNKRDDYIQQESAKQTNKVSKLRALRDAKNKTQRIKQNGILIEKLSAAKTSTANAGRQSMKNTKLSKLRNKLLK